MDWNLSSIPCEHPTPSVIVSEEIVHSNIQSMQAYCREHGLQLRPHTKTHKSKAMARKQVAAGAIGLTVAKVGEAEVMSEVCDDIFIAYPAIGAARTRRAAELAKRIKLAVGVDSIEAAQQLSDAAIAAGATIGIYLDVEVGFRRTGVIAKQVSIQLCHQIAGLPGLQMLGVMCFPGHILPNADDAKWKAYQADLQDVVDGAKSLGVNLTVVSGGSTPTAKESHRNPSLTEIRPGTYIYNDWNEVRLGVCKEEEVAARIIATVISTPETNKIVVDAGSKTLSSDRNAADQNSGFGHLPDFPNSKVVRLSEEHGEIQLAEEDLANRPAPRVGERIWIIPNHICVCVNLQNEFFIHDGNSLHPSKVDARGLLS